MELMRWRLLNHGCALSVNLPTKGALRLCLCDLKVMTQLVHPTIWRGPAVGCWLIGSSPISSYRCSGPAFLSRSKASCAHTSVGHCDRDGDFIIHVITSNTFLWLDGPIMQSWAPFRATTWDLLLMTCFWCQRWSDELVENHFQGGEISCFLVLFFCRRVEWMSQIFELLVI